MGKGMMICIDRFTTVRMYDLVQQEWKAEEERLKKQIQSAGANETDALLERLNFMKETDMAVVISKSQNEIKEFDEEGLDIREHRKRLEKESLDDKFKDDEDPLRLVFVCAMWITGFSVSSLSTLYLDKPMKSHTLMQTIARANRVFKNKNNGMIVDYVGVFRHLQKALATYATGNDENEGEEDPPVKNKAELIDQLKKAIQKAKKYCKEQGVDLEKIIQAEGFEKSKFQEEFAKILVDYKELNDEVEEAADKLLINEEKKKEFIAHAKTVNQLYKSILPDPEASQFLPARAALKAIADLIKRLGPSTEDDLNEVREEISDKLDQSIKSKPYIIDEGSEPIDLSNIDFEKLKERFAKKKNKRVELQKVKATIEDRLEQMMEENRTRIDFKEEFEEMIERYNNYSITAEIQLEELFKFVQKLDDESERHMRENLSEEQLALFDVVTLHDKVQLTKKEREKIKEGIKELLDKLKSEKLVLDWSKYQKRISDVKVTIEKELDGFLPDKYDRKLYAQTCSEVFDHVMQRY
jgi:type I restriction enzyme R subunit